MQRWIYTRAVALHSGLAVAYCLLLKLSRVRVAPVLLLLLLLLLIGNCHLVLIFVMFTICQPRWSSLIKEYDISLNKNRLVMTGLGCVLYVLVTIPGDA